MVEIIHRCNARVLGLGAVHRTRSPKDFENLFRDGLAPDRVSTSLVNIQETSPAQRQARVARLFEDACRLYEDTTDDVFCVLDVAALEGVSTDILDAGRGLEGVTVILFEALVDPMGDEPRWRDASDVVIRFSTSMAKQGIYPAIDAARTFTRQSCEQTELIDDIRGCLDNGDEQRRLRLMMYLSQPFEIAEYFNGFPGNRVTPEVVFRDARALLNGEFDQVPLEQLRFLGALDELQYTDLS